MDTCGEVMAAEIALQFAWGNFEAVEQSMLIGTSPEFEFSAYTLMALSGHLTATFNYASYSIDLTVKTVSDSGFVRMGAAFPGHGSGNTNPTSPPHKGTTKKSSHGSNPGLQALIDSMVAADVDAPSATDVVMNWGNKVKGTTDESKDPLFTHVNEDLFKRPVYSKLIDVWNANVFNPQVCTAEVAMSGNKKALLDAVTKVFVNTTVFGLAHDYLVKEGVTSGTIDAFYPTLFQLWFGTYSRCHGALGSSGWEHVFSGEWKGSEIDGQHDWPRYYLLEKAGKINYHGYDSHDDNLIGTFQYTWQTYLKKIGGFFTGTSPVFDFSAFTVCALTSSGANGCKFNVKGFPIGVTSYTQSCAGGSCLSTSYPSN
uniref:Endoribonuclease n=1 Tax=Rhabditophanes sp. KR3021 TaxID=114890 RepID=A0AC35TG61_9BILA